MVDTNQLYWAAGFLEGEGTFGVYQYPHSKRGVQYAVAAEQVQREPLERLLKIFGGSINNGSTRSGRNRIFRWRCSGERARGIAMTLYTLLSPRRQGQVQKMLSHHWRPYNRRHNGTK
jgi:hypothetical protein